MPTIEPKKERPQNKHLVPIKKGVSGNPNGRPKGSVNRSTIAKRMLAMMADVKKIMPANADILKRAGLPQKGSIESLITGAQIIKAISGDARAYEKLMDSAYGKAPQSIDHKSDGEPIVFPRIVIELDS